MLFQTLCKQELLLTDAKLLKGRIICQRIPDQWGCDTESMPASLLLSPHTLCLRSVMPCRSVQLYTRTSIEPYKKQEPASYFSLLTSTLRRGHWADAVSIEVFFFFVCLLHRTTPKCKRTRRVWIEQPLVMWMTHNLLVTQITTSSCEPQSFAVGSWNSLPASVHYPPRTPGQFRYERKKQYWWHSHDRHWLKKPCVLRNRWSSIFFESILVGAMFYAFSTRRTSRHWSFSVTKMHSNKETLCSKIAVLNNTHFKIRLLYKDSSQLVPNFFSSSSHSTRHYLLQWPPKLFPTQSRWNTPGAAETGCWKTGWYSEKRQKRSRATATEANWQTYCVEVRSNR